MADKKVVVTCNQDIAQEFAALLVRHSITFSYYVGDGLFTFTSEEEGIYDYMNMMSRPAYSKETGTLIWKRDDDE